MEIDDLLESWEVSQDTIQVFRDSDGEMEWLKYNCDLWPLVETKWKASCAYRKNTTYNSNKTLVTIVNEWPCLKNTNGHRLCRADDYYYRPHNISKTTLSGIAAYRSALTLDWLAAEDHRQRELAAAFETEASPPIKTLSTECIAYPRPASGKVARLMLELLKNLEGDDGSIVTELIQALIRTKLLVETSMLESEPDLDSLVKTPGVMMGEPHTTFPRILAMTWMIVTDPVTTKKFGWCPINRVNRYLTANRPIMIAKQMKTLEPIIARARFIMEEFIQHVTPLNMYQRKAAESSTDKAISRTLVSMPPATAERTVRLKTNRRHSQTPSSVRAVHLALAQEETTPVIEEEPMPHLNVGRRPPSQDKTSSSSATRIQGVINLPFYLIAIIVIDVYVLNIF